MSVSLQLICRHWCWFLTWSLFLSKWSNEKDCIDFHPYIYMSLLKLERPWAQVKERGQEGKLRQVQSLHYCQCSCFSQKAVGRAHMGWTKGTRMGFLTNVISAFSAKLGVCWACLSVLIELFWQCLLYWTEQSFSSLCSHLLGLWCCTIWYSIPPDLVFFPHLLLI